MNKRKFLFVIVMATALLAAANFVMGQGMPEAEEMPAVTQTSPSPVSIETESGTVVTEPNEDGTSTSRETQSAITLDSLRPNRSDFSGKNQVTLNGKTYFNSLTRIVTRRIDEAVYSIGRKYTRFTCTVGVSDRSSDIEAKAIFRIIGDEEVLYESDSLGIGNTDEVDIDVTDVLTLQLQATKTNGSGMKICKVAFANARLIPVGDTSDTSAGSDTNYAPVTEPEVQSPAASNDEIQPQIESLRGSLVFQLLVLIICLPFLWVVFTKAGQPGWSSLIPIYNIYKLCVIANKPGWWTLLFFVPLVNIIIGIIIDLAIARKFGKGAGFGIGLFFLPFIFLPILAFSRARYERAL